MSSADENELPQTYAVRLTEHAQRDVDLATLHFADTASAEIAVEWREGFYTEIAALATFPRRFLLAPERFRSEVRQMLYRRARIGTAYRVLFTIVGEGAASLDAPTVRILHVRHTAARPLTRTQIRVIEASESYGVSVRLPQSRPPAPRTRIAPKPQGPQCNRTASFCLLTSRVFSPSGFPLMLAFLRCPKRHDL